MGMGSRQLKTDAERDNTFMENDCQEKSGDFLAGPLDAERQPFDHRMNTQGKQQSNWADPVVMSMWTGYHSDGRIFTDPNARTLTTLGFSGARSRQSRNILLHVWDVWNARIAP